MPVSPINAPPASSHSGWRRVRHASTAHAAEMPHWIAVRFDASEISTALAHLWRAREDRYSELRTSATESLRRGANKVEMSYIGG